MFVIFSIEELSTPLPVELTTFTATPEENLIVLNWQTATELNNMGFEVHRAKDLSSNWEILDFVQGKYTSLVLKGFNLILLL